MLTTKKIIILTIKQKVENATIKAKERYSKSFAQKKKIQ